ncbi:hypothetical protein H4J51_13245 [Colwellia sp. MB02u-18]|uniref:hypothetical protein n=1 Tax=unclassified Colwellia TaxID=196834 RepID=UPI0015F507DE|nr:MULTISPECIES: hypothetical protein [unclassified Colwellia]MBA6225159.1 hypothetical protein [Colwellia sp. MB3u-45]MBA6268553.1 hypothetical protein [Colwellia sp. MB3u-43]MBA6320984.1 hypothetical protein [Colwellia sp. MB02u-19]MBA6325537.1 hypothetical protein [Colwellia sp. MB02u-18]MBA6332012.1 hypothetical protein [Colwellia sp. MB02u-12]
MKNIFKLATIAMLALVASNSQATQLVKVQAINAVELVEITKLHLAQSIKLNTIVINPIEKIAHAQVTMNDFHVNKGAEIIIKAVMLAE